MSFPTLLLVPFFSLQIFSIQNSDLWNGQYKRQGPCWTPLHGFKKVQPQVQGHGIVKRELNYVEGTGRRPVKELCLLKDRNQGQERTRIKDKKGPDRDKTKKGTVLRSYIWKKYITMNTSYLTSNYEFSSKDFFYIRYNRDNSLKGNSFYIHQCRNQQAEYSLYII